MDKAISRMSRCAREDSKCLSHQGSIYGEVGTMNKDLEEKVYWEGKIREIKSSVDEQ